MEVGVQAPDRVRARNGFTVIEIIISVLVLTVGVLGMAGTTAYVVRQVSLAEVTSKRAQALASVVERVRGAGFDSIQSGSANSGSDSVGIFEVAWTSAADGSRSMMVTIVIVGPGLTSITNSAPILSNSVSDTFTYRVIRP